MCDLYMTLMHYLEVLLLDMILQFLGHEAMFWVDARADNVRENRQHVICLVF